MTNALYLLYMQVLVWTQRNPPQPINSRFRHWVVIGSEVATRYVAALLCNDEIFIGALISEWKTICDRYKYCVTYTTNSGVNPLSLPQYTLLRT